MDLFMYCSLELLVANCDRVGHLENSRDQIKEILLHEKRLGGHQR